MNIAILNVVGVEGSTGKIATKLAKRYMTLGHDCKIFHGRGQKNGDSVYVKHGMWLDNAVHYTLAKYSGKEGYYSTFFTKRLLRDLIAFRPDRLIVLNLHGHWLNVPLFLNEVSKLEFPIDWLMCDEYPFTARCEYTSGCDGFKSRCQGCTRYRNVDQMYRDKEQYYGRLLDRTLFSSVEYIVNRAKESSLIGGGRFDVKNTGIDTDFYHPVDGRAFREAHHISEDQILLIDVAPLSNKRKGVEMFIEAARLMADDGRFVFVNVGYDGKEHVELPYFIAIPYVSDQEALREIYSAADCYICTSVDDALPNACVEAMSCGTPIIAFNISGMPYLADYPVLTLIDDISAPGMIATLREIKKKSAEIAGQCRSEAVAHYDFLNYADNILGRSVPD